MPEADTDALIHVVGPEGAGEEVQVLKWMTDELLTRVETLLDFVQALTQERDEARESSHKASTAFDALYLDLGATRRRAEQAEATVAALTRERDDLAGRCARQALTIAQKREAWWLEKQRAEQAEARVVFVKHLKNENTAAHLALDRCGAPTTKAVPRRDGAGTQDITIGLAERIDAVRECVRKLTSQRGDAQ